MHFKVAATAKSARKSESKSCSTSRLSVVRIHEQFSLQAALKNIQWLRRLHVCQ